MIGVTNAYVQALTKMPLRPVHRFSIEGYPRIFVWRQTGRQNESAWITAIGDWGIAVDEQNGSCTIDDLTVTVLDKGGAITNSLALAQLEGRRCVLRTGFDGMDLEDYTTVFTGIINSVQSNPDGTYDIVCNDFGRLAQRIIYLTGDAKTVTTNTTSYNGATYTTHTVVQKYDRDGELESITTSDSEDVNGTVGTTVTTDAGAISSDNPRRVVGHPLDILLNILRVQIGMADGDINLAGIEAYRDQVFAGMQFDFTVTSAPNAKDFIEQQLLKPLGGYNYQDNLGRFCVCFMLPLPNTIQSAQDINRLNMTELPQMSQSTLVNVVTHRFDKDDSSSGSGTYMAERNNIYATIGEDVTDITGQLADSQASGDSNLQGQVIIESDGMRSGFQGFLLADAVAQSYFNKYGSNNLTLSPKTLWPAFRLFPGEFARVSHPLLPNRKTGVIGLAPTLFQVNSRRVDFTAMTVTLTLTDASGMQAATAHKIVGDGYSTAYSAASSQDRSALAFMTTANGKQLNGDDGVRFG